MVDDITGGRLNCLDQLSVHHRCVPTAVLHCACGDRE